MGEVRTRSDGPHSSSETTEKYIKYTNGTTSLFDSKSLITYYHNRGMTDTVTPNYRKRISNGEIINNPMSLVVESLESGGGSYSAIVDANGVEYYNNTGSTTLYEYSLNVSNSEEPAHPQVDIPHLVAQAKAFAISKINPSDYKFGEDLLELKETLQFLSNPAKSILNLSKNLVRDRRKLERKYKRAEDVVQASADLYLSYQFGFQPLLRSSLDAIENYNRSRPTSRPKRLTARGFARDSKTADGPFRKYFSPSTYDTYSSKKEHVVEVKANILYDVLLPTNDLQMNLGLRPSDIPETLWAVVPLSFMVDRIWDISTAIRGLTNLSQPHLRILAGSVVIKEDSNSDLQFIDQVNPGATTSVSGDLVKRRYFSYSREIWHPSVLDTIPPSDLLNVVSNAQYISDLTALSVKALRPVIQKIGEFRTP